MSFIASVLSFCLGLALGTAWAGRRVRPGLTDRSRIAPDAGHAPHSSAATARTEAGETAVHPTDPDPNADIPRQSPGAGLAEASASLGRIAHELVSPVAALHSSLEVQGRALARLETDSNAPEYRAAARALTTAQTALAQIEELTDAMRSAGRLGQLPRQATPARGLVDAALLLVGHRLASVEVERRDVPGVLLHAVPGEIIRVLVNLLVNASRALPEGGNVRITTRSGDAWGEIQVEDSGAGIATEDEARIFLPGHTSWRTGEEGDGHGLALAREAVERNGGELRLVKGELSGAAFLVRLPRAETPPRPSGHRAEPPR